MARHAAVRRAPRETGSRALLAVKMCPGGWKYREIRFSVSLQPAGRVVGKPGFSTLLHLALMIFKNCIRLGGRSPPRPSPRVGGWGKPGFPGPLREGQTLPRAGGWGTQGPPSPCLRAAPSQTLPPGGGLGKPGFPGPLREGQALPRAGVWGTLGPPCSR